MTGGQGLIPLALLCLWLCHDALAKNPKPCQPTSWNNGFSTFLKRHVRPDTPKGLDQNVWMAYIRKLRLERPLPLGCSRSTQSFLDSSELEQVMAVCTDQGGRHFSGNLCISMKRFSFTTVCSDDDKTFSVKQERKHLILACDVVDNQCLPVHFEGNRNNATPKKNAKGCRTAGVLLLA